MVSLCISKIAYNKRINTRCARWGQKHVGSLRFARYYSLRIFARCAGVMCWSNMQKENGDTEIAFLAALALWLVTIGTGWLSKLVFEMWQNGSSIEFVSRKARILNHFPTSFIFFLSLVVLAIMVFYAAKQTLKFVTYLRN